MGLVTRLLSKRDSLENPNVALTAEAWEEAFGKSFSTAAGVSVTTKKAMTYAAVWRAVGLISSDVGKLPLFVYRRNGEGKKRAVDHPAYQLLRYKPNSEMTSFVFRQTLLQHGLLRGNGYAYIDRAGSAAPLELIPLDPDQTWPVRANGVLYYVTTSIDDGRETLHKLRQDQVLHVKGMGWDGLTGYSVIEYAKESLAMGLAAREYGARFYSNNARAGVLLEHPGQLSKEAAERIKTSWDKMHAGLENSHKTAILEEGMKANVITISARDAQLIEQRQFEIREVANWFGVPPHKLGDSSRTAYNSLEQENQSYLDDALDRWLVAFEEECRDKLLTEEQKRQDSHVIEFERKALVRSNLTDRANYYKAALAGAPWMTVNQVRGIENENPLDDPNADTLLIPLNIQQGATTTGPVEPVPQPDTTPAQPDANAGWALRSAHRKLLVDAISRMVKRVGVHARRHAKHPDTYLEFLGAIREDHEAVIAEATRDIIEASNLLTGRNTASGLAAERVCEEIRSSLTTVYDMATKSEFADEIEGAMSVLEADLPNRITNEIISEEK